MEKDIAINQSIDQPELKNIVQSVDLTELYLLASNIWLIAIILSIAWIFVARYLWYRGAFAGNLLNVVLMGLAMIGTIIIAAAIPKHQSLFLLGIPAITYFWAKYIEKKQISKQRVIFIYKKQLDYGITLLKELTEQADKENILIESQEIDSNASQALRVNTAISKSPNTVVVVPTSSDSETVKDIAKLYQRNIPVVVVDREIDQHLYSTNKISSPSHIISNFQGGGVMASEAMEFSLKGTGNIAIIAGPKESNPSETRLGGFVLKTLNLAPQMLIVYCGHCISWEKEEGRNMMLRCGQELNENNIKLDGVFCCNDTLALGAIEAIDELYKRKIFPSNTIKVVGFDGLNEMKEMIKQGKAAATIDVQIHEQATAILQEIMNTLGKPIAHIKSAQNSVITKPEVIRVEQQFSDGNMDLVKTTTPQKKVTGNHLFDAIFFDMDGLIIDNEISQMKSFNKVLNPYGIEITRKEFEQLVGVSQKDIFDRYKEKYSELPSVEKLMSKKKKEYFPILQKSFKAATGMLELKKYLRSMDVKVGVVSSSPKSDIKTILDDLGLNQMDLIFSSLDSLRPKPYPDSYIEAANTLGIPKERCLVLEDSSVGIQSATAAGMKCAVIPNSFTRNQDLAGADYCFNSLSEVKDWLQLEGLLKQKIVH